MDFPNAVYFLFWMGCGYLSARINAARGGTNHLLWVGLGLLLGPLGIVAAMVHTPHTCAACGRGVHANAAQCPHCHAKVEPKSRQRPEKVSEGERKRQAYTLGGDVDGEHRTLGGESRHPGIAKRKFRRRRKP